MTFFGLSPHLYGDKRNHRNLNKTACGVFSFRFRLRSIKRAFRIVLRTIGNLFFFVYFRNRTNIIDYYFNLLRILDNDGVLQNDYNNMVY